MSRLAPIFTAAAACAAASLGLAACVDLAPSYRRPAMPVPEGLPATAPGPGAADSPAPAWRAFFGDPDLAAVIDQALVNNRDLRIATANVAAARGQYVNQRSNLFPKLNATAAATFGQTPAGVASGGAAGAGGARGVYNERLYELGAGVSAWQLDLFGKVRNSTRAALETLFATAAARDAARVTLVGEVATDWLTLGADRAQLAIARDTLANGESTLSLTKARFGAGVASDLDVAQAETIVEQARSDIARLTTQVDQDRDLLELVVGSPVADGRLPTGIDRDGVVLAELPMGLSSRALLARPDVVEAEDQLKGADANIGAARAAFFPDISLTGSGGVASLALSTLFRSASETWSFAPTVTQPIFDFGANRGNLAYAKAQRDAAVSTYEKSIQTAFREVADALARRRTIDDQLAAQQGLADSAARAYRLSDARYQRGSDTFLNALIAQRTLYSARQSLVTSRQARAINLVTLYTSLGGGIK